MNTFIGNGFERNKSDKIVTKSASISLGRKFLFSEILAIEAII